MKEWRIFCSLSINIFYRVEICSAFSTAKRRHVIKTKYFIIASLSYLARPANQIPCPRLNSHYFTVLVEMVNNKHIWPAIKLKLRHFPSRLTFFSPPFQIQICKLFSVVKMCVYLWSFAPNVHRKYLSFWLCFFQDVRNWNWGIGNGEIEPHFCADVEVSRLRCKNAFWEEALPLGRSEEEKWALSWHLRKCPSMVATQKPVVRNHSPVISSQNPALFEAGLDQIQLHRFVSFFGRLLLDLAWDWEFGWFHVFTTLICDCRRVAALPSLERAILELIISKM